MFAERYVLICPAEHRFSRQDSVSVADLAAEFLLLNEDAACPVRRFVADLFEQAGMMPHRQYFATSQEQIVDLVHGDLGVSIAGERGPAVAPVISRPITAHTDCRQVVLATVAGRQLGPSPSLFLKLMRARAWSPPTGNAPADQSAGCR
jgi:DNA-binding transcriptional LysR family regulator